MELVVAGVVQSSIPDDLLKTSPLPPQMPQKWQETMQRLSAKAYVHYHKLIYETPEFLRFFE